MIINRKKISVKKIKLNVKKFGYHIIKSVYSELETKKIVNLLGQIYKNGKEVKKSGHYKKNMKDIIRLDVGEYPASIRFARFFFLFPWNKENKKLKKINEEIYSLRSNLSNFGRGLWQSAESVKTFKSNRFCMSYIIQYPRGGGFMSKHREYKIKNSRDNLYVVYLALTSKFKDYQTGGAYIIKKNKEFDIEKLIKAGDIVIYNGSFFHGVRPIDQNKKLEIKKVNGRMIMMPVINYFK